MPSKSYSIYPTLLDSFYWCERLNKPQEILDKINRIKGTMPEAAKKGIAFENVVNTLLKRMPVTEHWENYKEGDFLFSKRIVDRVVLKLAANTGQQKYIQAIIPTPKGKVKVYGFVDYTYPKMYVDLKTTGKYVSGKYGINNQHGCYTLIAKSIGAPVDWFNYLVTDFEDMYVEPYESCSEHRDRFVSNLCDFIDFLEENREKITDTKIFTI